MLDRTLAAASSDSPAIAGVIGLAILLIIVVGILVKLIIVLTRCGKNEVKDELLGPVFKSGAIQLTHLILPAHGINQRWEDQMKTL